MLSKKFVLHVMHFITLKRILRYLKGTLMHDIDILLLFIDHLVSYSDVDLVAPGPPNDNMFFPVSVSSLSIRATVVFCDNVSTMNLDSNPIQHQHTKHVKIDSHFFILRSIQA
uniref:Uncharacterized protein n=1 Tax=Lactuca sativa TaxID=4236 RepID=A0A9R1X7Z1_LACSA|nr:hypothetical protein LSAT_V11C600331230 [Lactuca sativa]